MTGDDEGEINEQFHAAATAHAEAVALVKSFGGDTPCPTTTDPGHPRRWTPEKRAALDAALDQETEGDDRPFKSD